MCVHLIKSQTTNNICELFYVYVILELKKYLTKREEYTFLHLITKSMFLLLFCFSLLAFRKFKLPLIVSDNKYVYHHLLYIYFLFNSTPFNSIYCLPFVCLYERKLKTQNVLKRSAVRYHM